MLAVLGELHGHVTLLLHLGPHHHDALVLCLLLGRQEVRVLIGIVALTLPRARVIPARLLEGCRAVDARHNRKGLATHHGPMQRLALDPQLTIRLDGTLLVGYDRRQVIGRILDYRRVLVSLVLSGITLERALTALSVGLFAVVARRWPLALYGLGLHACEPCLSTSHKAAMV